MDEAMLEMTESVKQYVVLVPTLVRPKPDGGGMALCCTALHIPRSQVSFRIFAVITIKTVAIFQEMRYTIINRRWRL